MEIVKKTRDSNLELLRIVAMLLIVAHHYVVNSGLMATGGPILTNLLSTHSLYLLFLGAWGKTGINCFVFITGYFMCKSHITAKKFVKLVGELIFYNFVIYMIFWISGYVQFSLKNFIFIFLPVNAIGQNFFGSYIVFFLTIPFLNILIHNMNKQQHARLLMLCGAIYVLLGTLHRVTMNYVSWFIVLYFIASYIRLYPKKIYKKTSFWGGALLLSVIVSIGSIIGCTWLNAKHGLLTPYFFMQDANTFLAFSNGLCAFMFFKNINVPYNNVINTIAASTFGVLCIHANSDTMRQWLWHDTLNNVGAYYHHWGYLHSIISVACVFMFGIVIDMVRIKLIEKPFFKLWDRKIVNGK